jgi:hypothetical protein
LGSAEERIDMDKDQSKGRHQEHYQRHQFINDQHG